MNFRLLRRDTRDAGVRCGNQELKRIKNECDNMPQIARQFGPTVETFYPSP